MPQVTSIPPAVLVVEDDALVAMEMETRIAALGCRVIGPAGTLERARDLIDTMRPDAAFLDVNIRGRRVTPIAERLLAEGVPFALVTGYARLPFDEPALQAAPKLSKPIGDKELAGMLSRMLDRAVEHRP
ncbi:MAG: response regulator [Bauldia sp.]